MICPLKQSRHSIIEKIIVWVTRKELSQNNECNSIDCSWWDEDRVQCSLVTIADATNGIEFHFLKKEKK